MSSLAVRLDLKSVHLRPLAGTVGPSYTGSTSNETFSEGKHVERPHVE